MRIPGSGADPLGAMYFVAAILLGLGAVVVIALMFIPSDFLSRGGPRWVPGEAPGYSGPAPTEITPEQQARDEEMHAH